MYIGVVNYLPGMVISTIVIANVDMLPASLYDPSFDTTKCALIVAIDRERRGIFAVYISVELEQPLRITGDFGRSDVFGFEGRHGDEILLLGLP